MCFCNVIVMHARNLCRVAMIIAGVGDAVFVPTCSVGSAVGDGLPPDTGPSRSGGGWEPTSTGRGQGGSPPISLATLNLDGS